MLHRLTRQCEIATLTLLIKPDIVTPFYNCKYKDQDDENQNLYDEIRKLKMTLQNLDSISDYDNMCYFQVYWRT